MKIAVVGSRGFKDKEFVKDMVAKQLNSGDYLVSGGARGVDTWAEEIIPILETGLADFKIHKKIFEAKWDDLNAPGAVIKTNKQGKKYNVRAGYTRNKLIIDNADIVLAFWDGKSKGTKHSIDLAIKAGKPLDIYVR